MLETTAMGKRAATKPGRFSSVDTRMIAIVALIVAVVVLLILVL